MTNVLYDQLPHEWEGYKVNTWFQVGVQAYLVFEDQELMPFEKVMILTDLLFGDEDGETRDHPEGEDFERCIDWFLNGWCHDKQSLNPDKRKLMDYHIDQWRIYADFRQIYGINLNEADLHWWEFCGLLWNMPEKYSSFFQVISIRKKKITSKMSKAEKDMYRDAQHVYALEQPKKEYTAEQADAIDAFDQMMRERRSKRAKV